MAVASGAGVLRGFDHLMNLVLADVEEHYVVRLRTSRTKLRPAPGAAIALGAPCPHSMPSLLCVPCGSLCSMLVWLPRCVSVQPPSGHEPETDMPCTTSYACSGSQGMHGRISPHLLSVDQTKLSPEGPACQPLKSVDVHQAGRRLAACSALSDYQNWRCRCRHT